MKIILSTNCISLAGMLDRGCGYYLRSTKKGHFFAQRSRHAVPPDGHWRFIVLCAEIAQNGLYIADISIHWMELSDALYEAGHYVASRHVRRNYTDKVKFTYNARDVLNLKMTFGL